MADVSLKVNGQVYEGWTSARVTRSMEALAGSFDLSYSDRWSGQSKPWPIAEEDECTVRIGRQVVLTGYVDERELAMSASDHTLTVQGKDRAAAMVECSAVLSRWELGAGTKLERVAEQLAAPFGVDVRVQAGLVLEPLPQRVSVDPGDSAWEALEKACRVCGVLAMSDGQGGLVLTRAGSGRATTALVLGENILSASFRFGGSGKYRTYKVVGQKAGTDEDFGLEACSVLGEAQDASVRRAARVLLVRAESMVTRSQARTRAQWEATVRAARGDLGRVTVSGWTQGSGALWSVNSLVRVQAPQLGVDGEMLISEVTYSLDNSSGSTTEISLKRPDAFKPQPVVPPAGAWKELAGGVG